MPPTFPVFFTQAQRTEEELADDPTDAARHQGSSGAAYEDALHKVWSVMNELQK